VDVRLGPVRIRAAQEDDAPLIANLLADLGYPATPETVLAVSRRYRKAIAPQARSRTELSPHQGPRPQSRR
jgi:hypothetical protein